MKGCLIVCLLVSCYNLGFAQKQLVILKRERVVERYKPGDHFVFKQKDWPHVIATYVNNLSDTSVVTDSDTVAFTDIERVFFKQHSFTRTLGTFLVMGGVGYFLVDQINVVVVNGDSPRLDSDVNIVAGSALAVGIPMLLFQKKSQKMGYKYRLMTVKKGSPFFLDDSPEGFVSPYLPR